MAQLYKKTGSCSRPDGAQTDYPMEIWVGESANSPRPIVARVYPPAHNSTYVKATYPDYNSPYNATNPAKSVIGADSYSEWRAAGAANKRFHIDLGSAKIIRGVYYENYHASGTNTDMGCKNCVMQGSAESTAFAETTYATDTDWSQIGGSMQFEQHVASDVADP